MTERMMLRATMYCGRKYLLFFDIPALKVDVSKEVGVEVTEGMGDEVRLTAQGGYMMVRRTK